LLELSFKDIPGYPPASGLPVAILQFRDSASRPAAHVSVPHNHPLAMEQTHAWAWLCITEYLQSWDFLVNFNWFS